MTSVAQAARIPSGLPEDFRFDVSGDSNEVRRVEAALTVMRDNINPSVKAYVEKNDLVWPCLQWVVRWCPHCHVSEAEKWKIYEEYSKALESFCMRNGYLYLNPNPLINQDVEGGCSLVDHIHPDGDGGVRCFADARLKCRQIGKRS